MTRLLALAGALALLAGCGFLMSKPTDTRYYLLDYIPTPPPERVQKGPYPFVLRMRDPSIAEAYRRFGISPATRDLIVIKVISSSATSSEPLSADNVWQHLKDNVQGEVSALTDEALVEISDLSKIRKYYKLNGLNWLDSVKDETAKRKELESLILGGMALRGI